ncbi:TetR/AcrR family transcriptional regulator [Amycolatopsis jejuensis]|uniref:TetR/AcrR family transcriptional regulator n=1 Tax=Amycolatopsis jejuensis TaxID=330084 RepID=UPI00052582D6|nr:TetR/AcrR family transcriptional regulator [Amycolatopsis jejuensis]
MARTRGASRGRRAEALEAAAQVFYEKGYEAASIQDIADRLGLLKGSVYYYISSKEDVLYELVKSYHDETRAYFDDIAESAGPVVEKLRRFVATETAHTARHVIKSSLFFSEWRALSAERQAEIVAERDRHDTFVQDCIRAGQQEGLFRKEIDPRLTAFGILGMMTSVYRWYQPGGPASADDIGREFADFTINGLMA